MRILCVLIALVLLAPAVPAGAAEPTASEFVDAIYRTYVGKDAKGIPLNTRKARTLLTPGLMKLIDADAKQAARRNEVPELNGDPFVDAQDWDIKSFTVNVVAAGPGKAKATVSFKDDAQPDKKPVTLDLVKVKGGWRIDDFTGPSGSVRKFLSKR
jgi:hypothetical protein